MPEQQQQRQIYALLVGIDAYPARGMELKGCRKDVEGIEAFLQARFTPEQLQLRTLLDEQATYRNIVQAFRTHLCQAGSSDTVWFHFSGHGSEQPTASEFLATLEPNGKDQTLVTYYRDAAGGHQHLADKELAVLLHRVATLTEGGSSKTGSPHIVVTLDCCHSGSGTRYHGSESELRTRGVPAPLPDHRHPRRSLASYAGGYYQALVDQKEALHLPLSQHVLLSACESIQTAGDLPSGGLFTTGLLEALRQAGGQLNYPDLYRRTRDLVKKIRRAQTPKFAIINNFDPYQRFLGGSQLGNPERFP